MKTICPTGSKCNGQTTYTYNGDGVISCASSDTSSVTCSVDQANKKITIENLINSENISEDDVAKYCSVVAAAAGDEQYSQFEITMAIAMLYFAEEKCDYINKQYDYFCSRIEPMKQRISGEILPYGNILYHALPSFFRHSVVIIAELW